MSTDRMSLKKQQRKIELEDIAFKLFCEKGIKKTSVDEIVDRANVAKGTFYLYFKNKQMLVDELILREAIQLINDAIRSIDKDDMTNMSVDDKVIAIVDYIMAYFKDNPMFLEFIHRDLYRGILSSEKRNHIIMLMTQKANMDIDVNTDVFEKKLYLIFQLLGSSMYNAILFKKPYEIDDIKPVIYDTVRCIIKMPM